MENPFAITLLNDFIFCPASIYFHMVDADTEKLSYGSTEQIEGSALHEKVDKSEYTDKKSIWQGVSVYSEKYNLFGKIDIYDEEKGILTERKRKVSAIYDGYVFQLYAYYFSLKEMGFDVKSLRIHSMEDNKNYDIPLPSDNACMLEKFEDTIKKIQNFSFENFVQNNGQKCEKCVYENMCYFSVKDK